MAKESRGSVLFGAALALCAVIVSTSSYASVGRTAGSFNVSNSGAATYTIPIFTPPGPRGMQPSVALVYSSNAGVGYIGKGWSLAGLSSISGCSRTFAQDGTTSVSNGTICINGNRLRLQSGSLSAGGEWATEFADFSRVKSYVGPWTDVYGITHAGYYWKVESKDGLTYTYAYESNDGWLIDDISDRDGNRVHFTYASDTSSYAYHPLKIEWTRTSSSSTTFVYSMEFAYTAGANSAASDANTDLLDSISVKSSSAVVRKYSLRYATSGITGGKRLDRVTECADSAGTDCLSPTDITYQDGQAGVSSSAAYTLSSGNPYAPNGNFDWNGDGQKDLTYRRSAYWYVRLATGGGNFGSEIATGNNELLLMAGDPFGNGHDLLLGLNGTSTWHAFMWNGSGFSAVDTGIGAIPVILSDVNGDGRDDIVFTGGTTWGHYTYVGAYLSECLGSTLQFSASSVISNWIAAEYIPEPDPIAWPYYSIPGESLFTNVYLRGQGDDPWVKRDLDVNGDGRQDLILDGWLYLHLWPETSECWIFECFPGYEGDTSYSAVIASTDPYLGYSTTTWSTTSNYRSTGHINIDGCTDVMADFGQVLVSSQCIVGGGTYYNPYPMRGIIDWDGDGRSDLLVYVSGSTLSVLRSTGGGVGSPESTSIPFECNFFIIDADSDGLDDVGCDFNVSGTHSIAVYLHNGAGTPPDLATSFTDGFGLSQSVVYKISSQEGYTANTTAAYPLKDVTAPQVIARTATLPDGVGGTYTMTYSYAGAVQDVQGRGSFGFERIESEDSRPVKMAYDPSGTTLRHVKHVQIFSHDFHSAGELLQDNLYQSDNTNISLTTNTLSYLTLDAAPNNQRYFSYPSGTTADRYEVDGTKNGDWITHSATNNTFDSSGNLIASTNTITDKDASSPLYAYSWVTASSSSIAPSTTYWCLGLPTAISVTYSTTTGEASVTRSKSFTPDYANCRMSAESVEPSSGTLQVDTAYGYDGFGNVNSVSVTGRNPDTSIMTTRTRSATWGATGQFPVSETNPLSQITTRTFDTTFGSLLTETDPNSIVVANNSYDSFGRIYTESRPDGTYSAYSYNYCTDYQGCFNGDPASGATGLNKTVVVRGDWGGSGLVNYWITHLDQFDRPIVDYHQSTAGWIRTGRQYDAFGRVYRETAPCPYYTCTAYWTTNTYDLLGRPSTQSHPQSEGVSTPVTTAFAYAGRTQTITDPNSKVTTKVLDVNGWMRRSRDHDSYGQNFSYDGAGSLVGVTDTASNTLFTASYYYGAKPFQYSTTDIDLGTWNYRYNSLGEVVSWQDPNTYASAPSVFPFTQTYDPLGRPLVRNEPEGATNWSWGNGTTTGPYSIGHLAGISFGAYGEEFHFDSAGRLSDRLFIVDGSPYYINYSYNSQGLLDSLIYPESTSSTRVKVKYGYAYGILQSVTDWTSGSAGTVYWTADTQNPRGQTTQETLGNGVVTARNFDAATGALNSIHSGLGGGTGLQNETYGYDDVGNVALRQTTIGSLGLTESFYYDNVNRLDHSTLNSGSGAVTNLTMAYDPNGNITSKSDVGAYDYSTPQSGCSYYANPQIHAVRHAGSGGGTSYCYDANGNMTSRGSTAIGWTSYNYPWAFSTGTESAIFHYGPDRQYYRQDYTGPGVAQTTYYVDGILEKVCSSLSCISGNVDWRHYIEANGQTVAIVNRGSSGNYVSYPLEDNQGSLATLANGSGSSIARQSFAAFGEQRDGDDWDGPESSGDLTTIESYTRRGYTGHNMLGRMGLIHMNGRVQDSVTGRFLSPDPYVTQSGFTQGYNRYAYVNNNPLTFVDPSGFCAIGEDIEHCVIRVTGNCGIYNLGRCTARQLWDLKNYLGLMCGIMGPNCEFAMPAVDPQVSSIISGTSNLDLSSKKAVKLKPQTENPCNGQAVDGKVDRLRKGPDFISVSIPLLTPFTGISLTVDRYKEVYVGPSIGLGYPAAGVSAGLLANSPTLVTRDGYTGGDVWSHVPSSKELHNYLSGFGASMGAGIGLSVNLPENPDDARSALLLTTPGVGFSYSFNTPTGTCKTP